MPPYPTGGMLYTIIGILILLNVVLPILSFRIVSYFVMEDDRFSKAIKLYFAYILCGFFALAPLLIGVVAAALTQDKAVLSLGFLIGGGMSVLLSLVLLFYAPMKIYYAGFFRALLFLFLVTCLNAMLSYGLLFSIYLSPVGENMRAWIDRQSAWAESRRNDPNQRAEFELKLEQYIEEKGAPENWEELWALVTYSWDEYFQPGTHDSIASSSESDSAFPEMKMKSKGQSAKERPAPKIYSAYTDPPQEKEEPQGRMMEEKPKVTASAQPAPSGPQFEVGQTVAMLRELTIPTDYGDLKIRKGDEVKLERKVGSNEWIAKRGVMQFRVQASDLREVR